MFNESVGVRINGDINKYIKRAESLGYTLFEKSGDKYIQLWSLEHSIKPNRNYCLTNNISLYFTKLISQEEFFGEKMRKQIDLEILELLVNETCETLNSFSAYDITSILRSKLQNYNIIHEDVRNIVHNYAVKNNIIGTNNGNYITYNKNIPVAVSTNTPNSINKPNISIVGFQKLKFRQDNIPKLQKLLNEKLQKTKTVLKDEVLSLRSEKRLSLKTILQKYFPGTSSIYVSREPNKIILSINPYLNSSVRQVECLDRIRTGFKTNNVKVISSSGKVEIIPC